ncbi:hypothetical protein niasHS_018032 [Heterodera schachtii]|uniref:Uncharacterized protein n=1 Tax=Heterodera schachtii TaxID=97005 RepID=A0ABD2HQ06_HETSC
MRNVIHFLISDPEFSYEVQKRQGNEKKGDMAPIGVAHLAVTIWQRYLSFMCKLLWNEWGFYDVEYSAQRLSKIRMDTVDQSRAIDNLPPRATGDQWQCTAQFAKTGASMSNALFVPPLVKDVFGYEKCNAPNRAHIVNNQRDKYNLPSPPNAKSVGFGNVRAFLVPLRGEHDKCKFCAEDDDENSV